MTKRTRTGMILTYEFKSDEKRREQVPHSPGSLSCVCKETDFDRCPGHYIPWHWHQEFEITYVVKGRIEYRIMEDVLELGKGGAAFVNTNAIHTVRAVDPQEETVLYTLFFDADFITGGYGNLFSRKYVEPVAACRNLFWQRFQMETPEGVRMLASLLEIIELFREEPVGYEFRVRATLCNLWLDLLKATKEIRNNSKRGSSIDADRVRQMLEYIEKHYPDRVMLEDIASSAAIGTRECTRCFARTLGVSPVEYLNRTRIRSAARMIRETDHPIGQIAVECGFQTDSYFGKLFRAEMGCTPREYRRMEP